MCVYTYVEATLKLLLIIYPVVYGIRTYCSPQITYWCVGSKPQDRKTLFSITWDAFYAARSNHLCSIETWSWRTWLKTPADALAPLHGCSMTIMKNDQPDDVNTIHQSNFDIFNNHFLKKLSLETALFFLFSFFFTSRKQTWFAYQSKTTIITKKWIYDQ